MTDPLTEKYTNNTLEEELRTMLVDKNNECNALKAEVTALKKSVAEEQEGKYRAYIKFADLQQELKALQDRTK
jgi:chromosome segregation ATPase